MILGIVEMKHVSQRKENEVTMKGTTHNLHVTNSTRSIKLPSWLKITLLQATGIANFQYLTFLKSLYQLLLSFTWKVKNCELGKNHPKTFEQQQKTHFRQIKQIYSLLLVPMAVNVICIVNFQ